MMITEISYKTIQKKKTLNVFENMKIKTFLINQLINLK
ncbi:hypothetical protein CU026_2103 [Enterococcus faecium]|nr:hypothetical protein M7W_2541 [Enterococcus faecium ATCC 8459 = NRRL B-2354]APV55353.1 transposase [Enterococcus faecium]EFF19708.1 putative transposase [Enterococcus faecium E1071]EFF24822.1 putative transposase [Enterococcus faecium E1636]EFF26004.1 putative transposase [Enterococcus faecium E1679]EFF29381.1 putative transposase [Enterococcus faecium U0317]EFF33597.1 putative transposase [Enterococcus faecium E1162]EHM33201.1 putative transposase [Enterococcus faecium E4452]EHM36719.1 